MCQLTRLVQIAICLTLVFGLYALPASANHLVPTTNGRIAWSESPPPSLWTIRPDGSDQQLLASLPTSPSFTAITRGMSFSADGSKLAVLYEQFFATDTLCGTGVASCWSIFLMNGDGSDRHVIFSSETIASGAIALSPDGRKVAFTMVVGGVGGDREPLFTIGANGRHLRQMTTPGPFQTDADPTWAPDGKSIAFDSNRDCCAVGTWSLYIVNAHNRHLRKVIPIGGNDLEPDWSPNGKKLVFIRTFDYPDYRIYSVDINGTDEQEIVRDFSAPAGPHWSPDGQRLIYLKDAGSHALAVVDASGTNADVVHTFSFLTSVGGFDWRPNY